jgi:predicted DNA-binding transcriptional regulator AlpA
MPLTEFNKEMDALKLVAKPIDDIAAMPIKGFCHRVGISLTHFYELEKLGQGPKTFKAGGKRLVSTRAMYDWIAEREAAA